MVSSAAMQPQAPHAPLTPELAAAKRRERRQGLAIAALGLVGAVAALATAVHRYVTVAGPVDETPQRLPTIVYLVSITIYGIGLYRALWAPSADPGGIPRPVRPWLTVVLTLLSWWVLAQIAGLASGALRAR